MTTISNCGKDERGKYQGGKAGDQGGEWVLRSWYNRPWNVVLRHPDAKVRATIADMAKQAANNNCIGYDQSQRLTFWNQLQKVGYKPESIKVACEADCSSGVAAIVKGAGYRLGNAKLKSVPTTCWTGNLRAELKKAGFADLTEQKYLITSDYLLAGDILLNEQHHVCTNVTNGTKISTDSGQNPSNSQSGSAQKSVSEIADEVIAGKWGSGSERVKRLTAAGYNASQVQQAVNEKLKNKADQPARYKVNSRIGLNIRKGAGTSYDKVGALGYGAEVTVSRQSNGWGYIGAGWVYMYYLNRV